MKKIALILLLFGLASCAGSYETMYKDDKGKFKDGRYEYEGNTVRFIAPELTAEVSYLPPEAVDLYFSLFKSGSYRNPFPSGSFIIYSLSLENRGKRSISFNPRSAMLITKKDKPAHPKDFATLYADLEFAGADDVHERMEAFRVSCLDTAVDLEPGEKVQGLLVFPARKGFDAEKAGLVIDGLFIGHETRTVPMFFGTGTEGKD